MLSSQTGHDGVLWGQRLHRSRKTWLYPVWQHFMIYVLIKPKLLQNMKDLSARQDIYKCLVSRSSPSCFAATWAWSTLWAVYAASQVLKFLSLHLYEAPGGSLWKGESSQKRLSFSDSQRCKLPGAVSWVYCLKEALARCMDRDKRTKQAAALFSALAFHTDHPTLRDKFNFGAYISPFTLLLAWHKLYVTFRATDRVVGIWFVFAFHHEFGYEFHHAFNILDFGAMSSVRTSILHSIFLILGPWIWVWLPSFGAHEFGYVWIQFCFPNSWVQIHDHTMSLGMVCVYPPFKSFLPFGGMISA